MARANFNRVAYGDAVLDRFAEVGVPSALKEDHKVFKAQHVAFTSAQKAVDKAESAYDTAAKEVSALDAKRDRTLLAIADKVPAAGLGKRTSPFAAFSKYSPSKLCSLPYASQTGAVQDLIAAIQKAGPPPEIAKLCTRCATENKAVATALKVLNAPLAVLSEARAKRDAAVPDWEKHLRRLKDAAKVAFRETPGRQASIFAELQDVQVHVRPRRRPRSKAPTAPKGGNE